MLSIASRFCSLTLLLTVFTSTASAQLTSFIEDFEAMTPPPSPAIVDDGDSETDDCIARTNDDLSSQGWQTYGNVYNGVVIPPTEDDPNTPADETDPGTPYPGGFIYGYGAWQPAVNNGCGGFSEVSSVSEEDETSANGAGDKYLNIYSDYNNRGAQQTGKVVNAIFGKNQIIVAEDIGSTVTFSFDAKRPKVIYDELLGAAGGDISLAVNNECSTDCSARAFMKTQDVNDEYATTNQVYAEMANISQSEWVNHSISIELLNPLLIGQNLVFGFETYSTYDDPSGVYYDNVSLTVEPPATSVEIIPVPLQAIVFLSGLLISIGVYSRKKNAIR